MDLSQELILPMSGLFRIVPVTKEHVAKMDGWLATITFIADIAKQKSRCKERTQ